MKSGEGKHIGCLPTPPQVSRRGGNAEDRNGGANEGTEDGESGESRAEHLSKVKKERMERATEGGGAAARERTGRQGASETGVSRA